MKPKLQSHFWLLVGVGIFLIFIIFQVVDVQAIVGDVDISGLVDDSDLAIIDAAYGANDSAPHWDARADINLDEYISLKDLALAGRSFGDPWNFHIARRVANGRNNNPNTSGANYVDAAVDGLGRIHVIWQESDMSHTYLFYTQLDAAGNALIEDVYLGVNLRESRLAVGPDGSAHIITHGPSSLFYYDLNPDGSFIGSGFEIDDVFSLGHPAIAVDAYNHAHIVYTKSDKKAMYTIIGNHSQLLPAAQLNPGSTNIVESYAIAISPDGARHILWHVYLDGYDELRYTRISEDGIVTINNQAVATLQGLYNHRDFYLAADSESAAHFLYFDFRNGTQGIYWSRVNPDGTQEAERLISNDCYSSAGSDVPFTIDESDQVHFTSYWDGANGHRGYGRLDRNGNILISFQRAAFDSHGYAADIAVDAEGRAMIVAVSNYYPRVYIYATPSDANAYDINRADLVLDKAHMTITKYLLRITESAEINLRITNGGPAQADDVVIHFSYLDVGGTTSTIDLPVGDIPAFTYLDVVQTIPVPDFEEVDAWEVTLTASTTTPETSVENNTVIAPFGVFPPPRKFNLEVLPYDETFSPVDPANAEPLVSAVLTVNCEDTGYSHTIESTEIFNIFWDIPLNTDPSNAPLYRTYCDVTLSKPGFSTSSLEVYAQRFSESNPYEILLSIRPVELFVNNWGTIEGVVKDNLGNPIANAKVRLLYGSEVTTNTEGEFLFEKIPAGDHTLQVWAGGYEPIQDQSIAVLQGHTSQLPLFMDETTRADVFGVVRNQHNLPLVDAVVKFFEDSTQIASITTGNTGAFSFSIDPYQDTSTYRLVTTLEHYENSDIPVYDLEPGIPLEHDVFLESIEGSEDLSTNGSIKSWVQDERWCKAYGDDEDLPLKTKILQKIGSKWCPSFQTVVNWGAFDYDLGLNFTEDVDGKTVTELVVNFTNKEFISYDVSSGRWHSGGESLSVTAQRIDWVELIAIDDSGNPVGEYVWHDDVVKYSSTQDDPIHPSWHIAINTLAPDWSQAAIRIFYTIGQHDDSEENNFRNWDPPADLGLVGSGSPSGADRQVITWMLSKNESSMRYSLADYRSWLNQSTGSAGLLLVEGDANSSILAVTDESRDVGTLSVVPVKQGPAQIGIPYAVDITISGFESLPAYALQFDLDFNETYLRLIDIQTVPDFAGPHGSWHRDLDLASVNAAGKLTKAAVVRLAAPTGLADGRLLRLVFMPVQLTDPGKTTKLDLGGTIDFADILSDLFDADTIVDLSISVVEVKFYLPFIVK